MEFSGVDIQIHSGLDGQDENLDDLTFLYEELQLLTVDAADPCEDIIAFAHKTHYFGIISLKPKPVDESAKPSESSKVRLGV